MTSPRALVLAVASAFVLVPIRGLAAQSAEPAPTPAAAPLPLPAPRPAVEHFAARREAVRAAIGEGVAVLFGAKKPEDMGAIRQTQDFAYLGGIDEPGHAMLLRGGSDAIDELLVPPFSRFAAQWEGDYLAPGEKAVALTGFSAVTNVRNLTGRLEDLLPEGGKGKVLYVLASTAVPIGSTPGQAAMATNERVDDAYDGRDSREAMAKAHLQKLFPHAEVKDLTPILHRLRATKAPAEVELLRRSSEIAAEGIAEAMRSSRPGLFEFQLAAIARYVFSLRGAGPDAYGAIVGAGKNGCVLHYMKNEAELLDGDLIVMDYAPTVRGYASDVTRTFPANGVFTAAQRKLVQDVYEVQQALIGEVKPGAKLSALSKRCSELLKARGYRSDHGPCHHVGLAVHDPSADELQEGMVITVEPGAYLKEQGMGCRIEDTILVTANGCEILSKGVPSTPDEIEALMRERGVVDVPVGLRTGK